MNLIPKRLYLDAMFNDFLISGTNYLKCDIYEKDETYFLETDISCSKKEDINIKAEFKEGTLKIIVPKKEELPNSKKIEIQ